MVKGHRQVERKPDSQRQVASTELNERGFHADAIERQLAHEEANKRRRAHNRASYLEERCKMMDAWICWPVRNGRQRCCSASGAGDEMPGN